MKKYIVIIFLFVAANVSAQIKTYSFSTVGYVQTTQWNVENNIPSSIYDVVEDSSLFIVTDDEITEYNGIEKRIYYVTKVDYSENSKIYVDAILKQNSGYLTYTILFTSNSITLMCNNNGLITTHLINKNKY
jgi:hypothetical protein